MVKVKLQLLITDDGCGVVASGCRRGMWEKMGTVPFRNACGDSPCFWKRTRLQPIRTTAEISAHIKILSANYLPLYQRLAQKATELRLLGMLHKDIAKRLHVSRTCIRQALAHSASLRGRPSKMAPKRPRAEGSRKCRVRKSSANLNNPQGGK